MTRIATLAGALMLSAGLVTAQDTDDTSWTQEEFMEAFPEMTEEIFDMIDANDDGVIDADEYLDAIDAGLIAPLEG
ncbi:MAG: EF-hand domain-containing protein [Rhodobacteraceae bacterium]|nr:EF-hand domain-containing protein [Paracoccaceae bacterium]TVR47614.1 MAG: EF-hand domain-containing protein [Paracoccaceae bacterium]